MLETQCFVNLPTRFGKSLPVVFWTLRCSSGKKYCDCDLPITNSFWKVLLEYSTVRCPLVTFSLTLEETMPSS